MINVITTPGGGAKPASPGERQKIKVNKDPVFIEKELLRPELIIDFQAFLKLNLLAVKVDSVKDDYEVGGGGLISNPKKGQYQLKDIFVPHQVVQPAFNSIDFGELINQGLRKYKVKDSRQVCFHFHKHPQGITDFSGQDMTQWNKVLSVEQPFIFLLIFGEFNYPKWKAVLLLPDLKTAVRMNVGFNFPTTGSFKVDILDDLKKVEVEKLAPKTRAEYRYGYGYGYGKAARSPLPADDDDGEFGTEVRRSDTYPDFFGY